MSMVQQDFQPFGVRVQRTREIAPLNVGATTIFIGTPNIRDLAGQDGPSGVAAVTDVGNSNLNDIASVVEVSARPFSGTFAGTVRWLSDADP